MQLFSSISNLIRGLENEFIRIPAARKGTLDHVAQVIQQHLDNLGHARIIVICTHNSRRSHLGQVWLSAAARYYGIQELHAFSGGTEATQFNPRMVSALRRAGFTLEQFDNWENPKYHIPLTRPESVPNIYFSKQYESDYNPQKDFIAIMVCDHADATCPLVAGAKDRIALYYADPKASDGLPEEEKVYDDKVREVGREFLFIVKQLITKD